MKRNYLLFCNQIAFCSIGILAVLIMGNLKIELKPPSKWSASLFFYSSISCSISGKDEKATSTKNRVLSGFVHLKGKDKARLDSR